MHQLNSEKFYEFVSQEKTLALIEHGRKQRERFWEIVEKWDVEEDIDYSIPFDDLIEMVEKSPQFFIQRFANGELIQNLCEELLVATPATRKRRRIL